MKFFVSAEWKRSHEFEDKKLTYITNGTQMLPVNRLNLDQLCFAYCRLVAATSETWGVHGHIWRKVRLKEFVAIAENKLFLLVELPAGNQAVGLSLVFQYQVCC